MMTPMLYDIQVGSCAKHVLILEFILNLTSVLGTARVNIAASVETPRGTEKDDWAKNHEDQSVLQQHIDFFDGDKDGLIWSTLR